MSEQRAPASTPEQPWSVARTNQAVKGWIERLGFLWVEGQLAQMSVKDSWTYSYLTLRDVEADKSLQLTCPTKLLRGMPTPPKQGDRVVVFGKPSYYEGRGTFSLMVNEIRAVGIGELLARIERLRAQLASEGLFDASRKKLLPFLPNRIGLITGRGSAAERDVLAVSHQRWPEVSFEVINTAVQGVTAVPEVIAALEKLDADPEVDVIIIARGGGSVQDLLPFSEEALQRAVAKCQTPVVSAIGHEPDNPVLDNVADLRAATPTDAAKRVVPDVVQERAGIADARARMTAALRGWVARQRQDIASLRSRPVMADPMRPITLRRDEIDRELATIRRVITYRVSSERSEVAGLRARVAALGPAATLARGYSVVQVVPRDGSGPAVVTSIDQAQPGSQLRIRVGDGSITAASIGTEKAK